MRNIFVLSILVFLFAECDSVVEFDVPEGDQVLVVTSILNPDSTISAFVESSKFVLEDETRKKISNASVTVFDESGEQIIQLDYSEDLGRYISTVYPEIGKKYRIEVSAEGYKKVNATTQISEERVVAKLLPRETGYPRTVQLSDSPQKNYYEFLIITEAKYYEDDSLRATDSFSEYNMFLTDVNSVFDEYANNLGMVFLDDVIFNGKIENIDLMN